MRPWRCECGHFVTLHADHNSDRPGKCSAFTSEKPCDCQAAKCRTCHGTRWEWIEDAVRMCPDCNRPEAAQ